MCLTPIVKSVWTVPSAIDTDGWCGDEEMAKVDDGCNYTNRHRRCRGPMDHLTSAHGL